MSFTPDDVKRIARLARIEIDDVQAQATQTQLNSIFDLIATMQAVNTEGIAPMAHAQDLALPLRDDAVTETDRRSVNQRSAPAVEDGLFLVPKVIE